MAQLDVDSINGILSSYMNVVSNMHKMNNKPSHSDQASGSHSSNDESSSVKRRAQTAVQDQRGYDSDGGIADNGRSLLLDNRQSRRRRSKISKKYPSEWYKTLVMLMYAVGCICAMTFVETLVHDKVPDQNTTNPLHDIAWDLTKGWPIEAEFGIHKYFKLTEIIGLLLMILAVLHILNHAHTSIVLRRFFFHFGTIYLYRVVTIYVTILPVPKLPPNQCSAKTDGTLKAIILRSLGIFAGGGMDITGKNMCGDYMYSGHTCVLTSSTLFILEYSPKRWWIYHYIVQILAIVGVLCISIAHEHYTIDIMAAYYVSTHHFWTYHSMATNQELKNMPLEKLHLARVWWYRIFQYMEGNISPIPRVQTNPLTKIKRIIERFRNRSTVTVSYNHL